jgi:hypothetical protein
MKYLILALALTLSAEEAKRQPTAVTEQDKQLIRLDLQDAEIILLKRSVLQRQLTDLDKQLHDAQVKLKATMSRVREISGADGYELKTSNWSWVKPQQQ